MSLRNPSSEPDTLPASQPALLRAVNGACSRLARMGLLRLPRLEAGALLPAARTRTGLYDFGSDEFQEPLAKLLRALEDDARLSAVGSIATHRYIRDLLENRLRLQHDRQRYPGISGEKIERPVFITGLPRTGTTLLHNLISQDRTIRVPLTWEVMHPSPPPTAATLGSDRRIAKTARELRWVDRLAPRFRRIHAVGAELPQECIAITTHAFRSIQFHTICNVPDYQAWLDSHDLQPAYLLHRAFLQQLQWRAPRARWVLKAPAHLFGLDALLEVYPDAAVVQTHRDPLQVVASIASHGTVLREAFSDAVEPARVGREWARLWADGLHRAIAFRESRAVAPERFLDLHYREIVTDPVAAVARIYAHGGLELSMEAKRAMHSYLRANPQGKHGAHRYTLEDFGLDRAEESDRFAAYLNRYDVVAGLS